MKEEKWKWIIEALHEKGYRFTSQRKLILDVILENECCCCKEIHYKVLKKDPTVGIATVYRMLNTLEELGAINRKNLYHISLDALEDKLCGKINLIDHNQIISLAKDEWYRILLNMLRLQGYLGDEHLTIIIKKEPKNKDSKYE